MSVAKGFGRRFDSSSSFSMLCALELNKSRISYQVTGGKAVNVPTKCFAGFLKCSKFLFLVMLNTIGKLHQHILNEKMKKRKKRTI